MKKDELVRAVAESAGLANAEAARAIEAVVNAVTESVASGNRVQVPGLGTFEPRLRNARQGRNPQTGEAIQIEAATVPGFKAAKSFKDAVADAPRQV
jgi:DNA-binding protein HU-beta